MSKLDLDKERRLLEAEATIRELIRLAGVLETSDTGVPIGDVFDGGVDARDAKAWRDAWGHARRIAQRSRG